MSTRASRTVAISFMGVVLVGVALVLLWPTPVDRGLTGPLHVLLEELRGAGFPSVFRYGMLEFSANAALFLALGFTLALFMPQGRRWMAPTLCVAGSFAAEFTQLVLRPDRQADPTDVLANSIGGLVGTVLVVAVLRRRERPRKSRHAAR